ncbi:MAG: response regulator [Chitinispirillaceae bacterium]|nr:response regulator [Chitinispirillaceae bacterium]
MEIKRNVLVVDDSLDTRNAIKSILTNEGYYVKDTGNPDEVITIATSFEPRIIILDVMMPHAKGLDLLKSLNVSSRNTEVIMMSAEEDVQIIHNAVNLGARGFLNKPVRYGELISQVSLSLDRIIEREKTENYQKLLEELVNARTKEISRALEIAEFQSRQIDLILNSMSEPLVTVDMDGLIIILNKAAEQVLGLKPECLGSPFRRCIHSPRLNQSLLKTITHFKNGLNDDHDLTLSSVPAKIQNTFFSVSINILKNSIDKPSGCVLTFQDQTEIFRAAQLRSGFLSLVAHEFRTPLASILNSASIFHETDIDKAFSAEAAQIILESTSRLKKLIDHLITFSNIQRADIKADHLCVNTRDFFDVILLRCSESSNKKHIQINVKNVNVPESIYTDPVLLGDTLESFIDNAIKFSPPDSEVEITAKLMEKINSDKSLSISILDRGPGIPAEQQSQMFEWFWQSENSLTRSYNGLGIGLPLALRAIEILGGTLNYAQYPLGGSIFTINVPVTIP